MEGQPFFIKKLLPHCDPPVTGFYRDGEYKGLYFFRWYNLFSYLSSPNAPACPQKTALMHKIAGAIHNLKKFFPFPPEKCTPFVHKDIPSKIL